MEDVGNLVYFTAIWYILCQFLVYYGYLVFSVLACCTKKNLASLLSARGWESSG
jgi:uncharacterized membrane protein